MPTPTPSACGTAGCWPRRGGRQGSQHPLPVCPEIPQGQRHPAAATPSAPCWAPTRRPTWATWPTMKSTSRCRPSASLPMPSSRSAMAKRGGFNGEIVSPVFSDGVIVDFAGGVAHNAVPDRAHCVVRAAASAFRLKDRRDAGGQRRRHPSPCAAGQERSCSHAPGHGQCHRPAGQLLLDSGVCSPAETAYLKVLQKLHASTDGQHTGHCRRRRPV